MLLHKNKDKFRSRLYPLLLLACFAAWLWLYFFLTQMHSEGCEVEVCLIKRITGIPCPSCGTTRSIVALISEGDFAKALKINPLGFVVLNVLIVVPLWIFFDFILKKHSLFRCYVRAEHFFRNPPIAVIGIALILANWVWNIIKNL